MERPLSGPSIITILDRPLLSWLVVSSVLPTRSLWRSFNIRVVMITFLMIHSNRFMVLLVPNNARTYSERHRFDDQPGYTIKRILDFAVSLLPGHLKRNITTISCGWIECSNHGWILWATNHHWTQCPNKGSISLSRPYNGIFYD